LILVKKGERLMNENLLKVFSLYGNNEIENLKDKKSKNTKNIK
jgi:hypothetical protein